MTISDFTEARDGSGFIRSRLASAIAARRIRRAGQRGGAISDHLLRDIGVTPLGIRVSTLAERNEARS